MITMTMVVAVLIAVSLLLPTAVQAQDQDQEGRQQNHQGRWNATGSIRTLWATPVMEYDGLFSDEQLSAFAADVQQAWSSFLQQRSSSQQQQQGQEKLNKVVTKSQAFGTSTKNDKDKINEEFFNYQSRHPINEGTLETVWQAFVFACSKFVQETGIPPIEYQRETLQGGSIEWTKDPNPRRGKQVCYVHRFGFFFSVFV